MLFCLFQEQTYVANAIDAFVCGKSLVYLEFLVLSVVVWIYDVSSLTHDMQYMFAVNLNIFYYLKFAWAFSFYVLLFLIYFEWVYFLHKDIIEIILLMVVLMPTFIVMFYNIFLYCKLRVSGKTKTLMDA